MNLPQRIKILVKLAEYMECDAPAWQAVKERAGLENGWFVPEFVDMSVRNICRNMLRQDVLENFCSQYQVKEPENRRLTGIVMAGNIPLVGFHDFLCTFLAGHRQLIKLSEKDAVLLRHLVEQMISWEPAMAGFAGFETMLKNCDAYIATGSNNSSRYFEYYFSRYPHIIRRNKTSAAVLTGAETAGDLERLSHDVHLYFGRGCRNVTQLLVPEGYDFVPLLEAFKNYSWMAGHHKYKNNYDYNLALHLLNNQYYMTNGHLLLIESSQVFAPISQLNYRFYKSPEAAELFLREKETDIQCVTGKGPIPFGQAQEPGIDNFADGVDTMRFLVNLD